MISMIVVGVVMSFMGGYVLDMLWKQFDVMGAVDLNNNWSSIGTQNLAINLWYLCCAAFPVLGVASFVKALLRRQGYNSYLMQ